MRKTVLIVVALAVAVAALTLWPFYDLYRLLQSAETHDFAPFMRRVDFPGIRNSLARQLTDTYWKLKGVTPPQGGLGVLFGPSIADPILAKVITPEALGDLLHDGWPANALPDRPTDIVGLSWDRLGTVGQLFLNSDYGIGRFNIVLPGGVEPRYQFALQFRLRGVRWRLTAVELPEPVRIRLTEELIKILERK